MFGEMGSKIASFLILQCWALLLLTLGVSSDDASEVAVKLLETPHAFSSRNFATFSFQVLLAANATICSGCSTICKLDHGKFSACEGEKISYAKLSDGNHSFEVCTTKGSPGAACATYDWAVDTVKPTAHITAATLFTNASRVPVNISFSEPCGGFRCSSVNTCNLLVYGAGEVIPDTLSVIEPNLKYSLDVAVSERFHYGRLILVMDKNICTDSAGNEFTRSENSSLFIHFDRRSVFVNMRTHIPEKLLEINSETRTILATNKNKFLKIYLYFTEPVMNSSTEILNSIDINQGSLVPISGSTRGRRRFGYQFTNITDMAIVSVSLQSNTVITRQGTPVASVPPVTFLYDSERPIVKLSTGKMRTKEKSIFILVKFMKPVVDFNSSHVSISGGNLQSFQVMSRRSYTLGIRAVADTISISIPENITADISGNGNRASNTLQVRHYSVPVESLVLSYVATAAFGVTALVAGFLTVSTTSLLSAGAFSKPNSILCSDPSRILFRIASHIQVFALSRWLAVTLPIEYYELARGLQWSVPYFNLPWEKGDRQPFMVGSNSPKDRLFRVPEAHDSIIYQGLQPEAANVDRPAKVFGLPLTPMEYASYFESQTIIPEAEYIFDPQNSHGWRDFSRNMFWLAVIGGSLILVHAALIMIIKFRKQNKDKQSYGALIFPRFEIFLLVLALPCFCEASAALIKGGTSSGMIVGVLIISLVAFMLLCLLIFLSFGITFGKLLQYKEVHQEGQQFHWYQEIIRVTLGPGKRGQWTWKNQRRSMYLTILGPLFEDLRGPPKYMLTQIAGASSNKSSDRIIASDDETEDAEAPFIQKLFGILRIYYTLIESIKRVILGIVAGGYNKTWSSRTPMIALLCITSFQLFFMVLKKPFIKKKVQFVEIISVTCELAIFAFCIVLLDREFSVVDERKLGISMVVVFLVAFVVQMINEWVALYRQIKQLDPITNSFFSGLKTASIGFVLFVCPNVLVKNLQNEFPINNPGETSGNTSAERNRSSASRSSGEKPWMRQIRELARSSFSKEGSKTSTSNDPSTSKTGWSGFFKKSGGSSASTSTDFKSKPSRLYKELEEIFASK